MLSCGGGTRPFFVVQIERDEQLLTFQSYMNRVRTPFEQAFSTNPLYYSLDVGPIHIIMLNAVRRRAALASVLSEPGNWHTSRSRVHRGLWSMLDEYGPSAWQFLCILLYARPEAVAAAGFEAQSR